MSDSIIQNSETQWDSPEWGFPKGRRNHQETDIACAIREWEEETGFRRESLKIIKNLCPFEEISQKSPKSKVLHTLSERCFKIISSCQVAPQVPGKFGEALAMWCFPAACHTDVLFS